MIITPSYFQGSLTLGQVEEPSNAAVLNLFIQKYEPEFLKYLMGYSLWKAFVAELAQVPITPRMVNLLYGAEFTNIYTGSLDYYEGLTPGGQAIGITSYIAGDIEIDISGSLIGATSYTNPAIAGKTVNVDYRVTLRSFGNLGSLATNLLDGSGNIIGWQRSLPFAAGEVYTIEFISPIPIPPTVTPVSTDLESPIANYIYYWYLKKNLTVTAGTGEVSIDNQNASKTSSRIKVTDVWNEMVRAVYRFKVYVESNATVYPEYNFSILVQTLRRVPPVYKTINAFGI